MHEVLDVIIRNGQVIDGTGAPRRKADVGIRAGRIEAVGDLGAAGAAQVIDAAGKVVCPGFIDTHTHSDIMLLVDRTHEAALAQGVTTVVLGQDGLSYAPLSPPNLRTYAWYLGGLNGYPEIAWDWRTVGEYRARFDRTVAVNTCYQVPHGTVRLEAVGFQDVPLVGEDLARAQRLIAEAFEQGAVAFSTGLSYYPASWSTTEELVELCRVAARYGRPFVTHTRTVWRTARADWGTAATLEAIEIGRRSGAPVHFSHFRTNAKNAGQVAGLMAPIERAIDEGIDVTLELYPYPSGSGYVMFLIPGWAQEGGPEALLRRLKDPATRRRVAQGMRESTVPPAPDDVVTYVRSAVNAWAVGMTFQEIAERLGTGDPAEAVLMLAAEEDLQVGYRGSPPEPEVWERLNEDFLDLVSRPYYMVGSDAIHVGAKPHPRTWGTFARFLRLSREHGRPPLEALINRMTALPARRFGLKDRGTLEPGRAADVVVFDPATVRDMATYPDPVQKAVGIDRVLVNGQVAYQDGRATGVLAGRSLPA